MAHISIAALLILHFEDIQPGFVPGIFRVLLSTYEFYVDRASRQALQKCIIAVLASPTGDQDLNTLKTFLQHESIKQTQAPSSRYVLLEWCVLALQHTSQYRERWIEHGSDLIQCTAVCLEAFLASHPRDNRRHASLVITRRSLRNIFRAKNISNQIIKDTIVTLTSKGTSSKVGNAPLLGVVAGVASRLSAVKPLLEEHISDFHSFYIREILGSRSVLPNHIAAGMYDFFIAFEKPDVFAQEIIPALEKSLLRAPEVILNDLVTPLIQSLPPEIDLSESFRDCLLKSLLPSTKSTSATIRNGSLLAYRAFVHRCGKEVILNQVADEILKNLKEARGSDQRIVLASMLAVTSPTDISVEKVPPGLSTIVPKENSETVLQAEVNALGLQVSRMLSEKRKVDSNSLKLFCDGLRNKKTSLRRIWALGLADVLWQQFGLQSFLAYDESAIDFSNAAFDSLAPSWNEAISNPVPSAQIGLATMAYTLFYFSTRQKSNTKDQSPVDSLSKIEINEQLKYVDGKQSLLLNPRVFTKIIEAEDLRWLLRVLMISVPKLEHLPEASQLAWAHALIFLIVSSSVPASVCQEASATLAACARSNPATVPKIIIDGVWKWISDVYNDTRDSAAVSSLTDTSHLRKVLRAICAKPESCSDSASESPKDQLIRLLVLCRVPLIGRVAWIDLCLRMGVDPDDLVSTHAGDCIKEVQRRTNVSLISTSQRDPC